MKKFSIKDLLGVEINLPSDEELRASAKKRYEQAAYNPNQFEYWFPVVKEVLDSDELGVSYPESRIFPISQNIFDLVLSENIEQYRKDEEVNKLEEIIKQVFNEFDTEKLFLKNSLFSAKHSWERTCSISKESNIKDHIANILYDWALSSGDYPTSMVVREMIKTEPAFYAFYGKMPVTEEYRLFSKDGKAHSYQAYWVKDSIKEPSIDNWSEELKSISKPSEELLETMIAVANKITKKLGGDWSVDFLIDENGSPWIIDMAITSQSYISKEKIELGDDMGGNAIKDSKRMDLKTLESVKLSVRHLLMKSLSGVEFRFPKEIGDKESFGDLDVVLLAESEEAKAEIALMLEHNFSEVVESGSVYSVKYLDYQVDFIIVKQSIDFASEYLSHGDMGNLLGYYAIQRGFKLGLEGLYRSENIPNIGKKKHYVTNDWQTALNIMGFEAVKYPEVFPSVHGMLNFVMSSFFFQFKDQVFDFSKMNTRYRSTIRKRATQRLFFTEYLGYSDEVIDEKYFKHKKKQTVEA